MRSAILLSTALLLSACGPSLTTTRAELDMTRYAPAPDAAAVVLERSGRVVLDYHMETDDAATFKAFGKIHSQGGLAAKPESGAAPGATNSMKRDTGQLLADHHVSSYTLEVRRRTKILTAAGLDAARVEEQLPPGANLESVTAATLLPDGRVLPLERAAIQTAGGAMRFTFPQAGAGAVLELHYKIHSRDLSGLQGWIFQGPLPVARSEFRIKMLAGTNLPYRFLRTGDDQAVEPKAQTALGMDRDQWMELTWTLEQLPAAAPDAPRAAVEFGG